MRTGAARGCIGHVHETGFYSSDAEFLALIVPFVTGGIAAGEPVIIGYDDRKCDLLRAELSRPDAVSFIADTRLYATPEGAIEAYRQQFERHVAAGAEQIRIAGDVPHEGNGGRFAGWDRYESAVNAVWQDYPVYSRCLYDATTVADPVRDVVERTTVASSPPTAAPPLATRGSPTSSACRRRPIRWRRPLRPSRWSTPRRGRPGTGSRKPRAGASMPRRSRSWCSRSPKPSSTRTCTGGGPSPSGSGRVPIGSWSGCTTPARGRPTRSPVSSPPPAVPRAAVSGCG
jgi:hypothetical protein